MKKRRGWGKEKGKKEEGRKKMERRRREKPWFSVLF